MGATCTKPSDDDFRTPIPLTPRGAYPAHTGGYCGAHDVQWDRRAATPLGPGGYPVSPADAHRLAARHWAPASPAPLPGPGIRPAVPSGPEPDGVIELRAAMADCQWSLRTVTRNGPWWTAAFGMSGSGGASWEMEANIRDQMPRTITVIVSSFMPQNIVRPSALSGPRMAHLIEYLAWVNFGLLLGCYRIDTRRDAVRMDMEFVFAAASLQTLRKLIAKALRTNVVMMDKFFAGFGAVVSGSRTPRQAHDDIMDPGAPAAPLPGPAPSAPPSEDALVDALRVLLGVAAGAGGPAGSSPAHGARNGEGLRMTRAYFADKGWSIDGEHMEGATKVLSLDNLSHSGSDQKLDAKVYVRDDMPDGIGIRLVTFYRFLMPLHVAVAGVELLTRMNYGINVGCFKMDHSTRKLSFESSIEAGNGVTAATFKSLMDTMVALSFLTCLRYVPAFKGLFSGSSPQTCIVAVEGSEGAGADGSFVDGIRSALPSHAFGGGSGSDAGGGGAAGGAGAGAGGGSPLSIGSQRTVTVLDRKHLRLDKSNRRNFLGKGGFGEVWRGSFAGTDVAVKISSDAGMDQTVKDMWMRELGTHASMNHPNIVTCMGVCEEDDRIFLVMQYCHHGDLHQALTERGDSFNDMARVRICKEIAAGMAYLHARKCLHLDLKALNVMLTSEDTAKVADFGLSRVMSSTGAVVSRAEGFTLVNAAPEILRGDPFGQPADVYAYSMILYQCIARKMAYEDENLPAHLLLELIKSGTKRPSIPSSVEPWARELMTRCWHGTPSQRPTFQDIVMELERHL